MMGFIRRLFGGDTYDMLIWQIAHFEGERGTKFGVESFIVCPTKRERELYEQAYEEGRLATLHRVNLSKS